ncbi:polymorphic toxin-type HINT domain-containing protein [Streptomyces bohaiensis]|uniref:polymorphic toxin-type HINT domain-containing protein n=1 Tax=Streptomyces bohaiensis TaxID=1431344 RepID=UPI003B81DC7B
MKTTFLARRRTASLRGRIALGVATVMVASLVQAVNPSVSSADDGTVEAEVELGEPVDGSDGLRVAPRPVDHTPRVITDQPSAEFPSDETHEVAIEGGDGPLTDGTALDPVGDLPVEVRTQQDASVVVEAQPGAAGGDGGDGGDGSPGIAFSLTVTPDEPTGATARTASDSGGNDLTEVDVRIDYSAFAEAYGGGYGDRLTLHAAPDCAEDGDCSTAEPVDVVNDTEQQTLTAAALSVPAATPMTLMVAATAEGDKGDYTATDLSPSSTWETDLSTGDFTWSYDIPLPDVPGELTPSIGLTYSAGSIDGRTSSTNNQGSWVGDGYNLWPGYIERNYKSCGYKNVEDEHENKVADLCWDHDNAFISLNGMAGELVPAGDNTWKLQSDNGTRIERLTSSARANGDNDNEYWRVTDPEGTQYYFGYHRLPGWSSGRAVTNSTWTVPVYSTKAGEPCYKATTEDSWCQQAWRWNLDYVVDAAGNVVTYYYDREQNSYGRFLDEENNTRYTRGGTLNRIEYGLTKGNEYSGQPLAKVLFTNSDRCLPGGGADCADITKNPQYWYDTPWDLNCDASGDCDRGRYSPSFWTTKRLTEITSQVRSGTSYRNVDSWKLAHHWGTADVDYQLLLSSIQRTGHSATPAITLPKTTFGYTQLANRLDRTGDGYAPFIKARLSSIADEYGGQVDVGYSAPACTHGSTPTPHTNTTRCFPQYLAGGPEHDPDLQWFNKYVTEEVTTTDRTGGSPDQVVRYRYLGGAAWRYDDNALVDDDEKTWSQWRGYGHVRVQSGSQTRMETQEDSYFLRGMHGDRRTPSGGTKSVSVTLGAGEGDPITDHPTAAGLPYKTVTFDKAGGAVEAKTVTRPWHHQTARSVRDWGTITADFKGAAELKSWISLDDGAGQKWRISETHHTYDTVAGRLVQVDDRGDTAITADDRCTRTTYPAVTDANLLNLPSREETVATRCAATPDRADDVVSDVRYAYDGRAHGQSPTVGRPTATAELIEHDGTVARYVEATATFDSYGRLLSETDLAADITVSGNGAPTRTARTDGRTSSTTYTPAVGIPTTVRTVSPPVRPGDSASAFTETTTLSAGRGLPTRLSDANGKETVLDYDALGRATKVWHPDRRTTALPSLEFTYRVVDGQPVAIGTRTLNSRGSQLTSYVIYDGLLRERQTQAPGSDGGRILTDTFHDERGLVTKAFGSYYAIGEPAQTLFLPEDADSVETQTRHTYDGLDRETETRLIAGSGDGGDVLSTTRTIYSGDRITILPPEGDTATTSIRDARGQLTEYRQHHQPAADADYDTTTYSYTPRGELASLTTPSGATWNYAYDQLGRPTTTADPDTGTFTRTYTDRGELETSTDARGTTLSYTYDNLGRKTELREGGPDGQLRATWQYDTVTGAKGHLARSTRWENGEAYVSEVTEYDRRYRPLATRQVVPGAEGALAGTYETRQTFDVAGLPQATNLPAAGGLSRQTVAYTHDLRTLQLTATELPAGTRLNATTEYNRTGAPIRQSFRQSADRSIDTTYTYEWGTRRLKTSTAVAVAPGPREALRGETYSYDEVGNVLSIANVAGDNDAQCFAYDHLRRITEAWAQSATRCADPSGEVSIGGPAPYHHSYTYDLAGNRETEVLHEQDTTRAYEYSESQPHTLTEVIQDAPGVRSLEEYGYDDSGNTVSRQTGGETQTLSWNPEGRVAQVENADDTTVEYIYDADGSRLIARTDSETTLYLGHTEVVVKRGAAAAEATRYIDLGAGHAAVIENDSTTSFTLADHHGTGNVAVNAQTLEATQRRTLPFGGYRGDDPASAWPGTRTFVGGYDDTATGLYGLGAREYDPALGRFISADPIMDRSDPQQLHGYSYSNNNPLAFSDPTGLFFGLGIWRGLLNLVRAVKSIPKRVPITTSRPTNYVELPGRQPTFTIRPTPPRPAPAKDPGIWAGAWGAAKRTVGAVLDTASTAGGAAKGCFTGSLSSCVDGYEMLESMRPLSPQFFRTNYETVVGRVSEIREDLQNGHHGKLTGELLFDAAVAVALRRTPLPRSRGGSCNSFVPGTHVLMADGTTMAIEDLSVGDEILATDPETGETGPRTVTAEITGEGEKVLVGVSVADADGNTHKITATDGHPFWLPDEDEWTKAADLTAGDRLLSSTGLPVVVVDTDTNTGIATVHNLTIEGVHTYYVAAGDTPVLVHNSNCRTASKYEDTTEPKARMKNVRTDAGPTEFAENLEANGWTRLERGPNIEYQKDGARYFLRSKAKTVEGWTADYYRPGSKKADIKIRLGDD